MKKTILYSPAVGTVFDIAECDDPVFADKVLGDGIFVRPDGNDILAPCDGVIEIVTDTLHAITMYDENKIPLILHIGIDTVELEGNGFRAFVKNGEAVKRGQKLLEADIEYIRREGYDPSVILIAAAPGCKVEKKNLERPVDRESIVGEICQEA